MQVREGLRAVTDLVRPLDERDERLRDDLDSRRKVLVREEATQDSGVTVAGSEAQVRLQIEDEADVGVADLRLGEERRARLGPLAVRLARGSDAVELEAGQPGLVGAAHDAEHELDLVLVWIGAGRSVAAHRRCVEDRAHLRSAG